MISYTEENIQRILQNLKENIREKKFSSSKFPLFVFICGEQILDENSQIMAAEDLRSKKNKRQYILDAIDEIKNRKVVGVIAEKLIETFSEHDSLTFEGILADISDEIIIIVESVGTFCELGAFSFSKDLVDKLYIINDEQHREDKSFINRGPIRKINDSRSGETKYIIYDTDEWKQDLELKNHFEKWEKKRISYTPPEKITINTKEKCQVDIKNFVYEVINILSIFQPITQKEFLLIYKFMRGEVSVKDSQNKVKQISTIFDMMVRLELITKESEFYTTNMGTCCNNYMFDLTINETEEQRAKILKEYNKYDPARCGGSNV